MVILIMHGWLSLDKGNAKVMHIKPRNYVLSLT